MPLLKKLCVLFGLALAILMDRIHTGNSPALYPKLGLIAASFDDDGISFIFHSHDTAADAANCGDFVAHLGVLAHFLFLLLFLALGAEEDEIQGHNEDSVYQKHNHHLHAAARGSSCCVKSHYMIHFVNAPPN